MQVDEFARRGAQFVYPMDAAPSRQKIPPEFARTGLEMPYFIGFEIPINFKGESASVELQGSLKVALPMPISFRSMRGRRLVKENPRF